MILQVNFVNFMQKNTAHQLDNASTMKSKPHFVEGHRSQSMLMGRWIFFSKIIMEENLLQTVKDLRLGQRLTFHQYSDPKLTYSLKNGGRDYITSVHLESIQMCPCCNTADWSSCITSTADQQVLKGPVNIPFTWFWCATELRFKARRRPNLSTYFGDHWLKSNCCLQMLFI